MKRHRIKNLKYDPLHADKRQRAYSHLQYLDGKMSLAQARTLVEYEKKHNCPTIEIVEVEQPKVKAKKEEKKKPHLDDKENDSNE